MKRNGFGTALVTAGSILLLLSGAVPARADIISVSDLPGSSGITTGILSVSEKSETKAGAETTYGTGKKTVCYTADTSGSQKKSLADYTDEERYKLLFGTDKKLFTVDDKPAGFETKSAALGNMTTVKVPCYLIDSRGTKYPSSRNITVHKALAEDVKQIFDEIYALPEKFPINTLVGFRWNSRGEVSGPFLETVTCMSAHAYGAAIDINMIENDYYVGAGNDLRDPQNPYYITQNVRDIFAAHGWNWGGDYEICTDTMHFQYTGLDMLSYNNGSPFKKYSLKSPVSHSMLIKNTQRRLAKLGYYKGSADGTFGKLTQAAVKAFQEDHGLKVTGKTGKKFYTLLWNLTNDMYDYK